MKRVRKGFTLIELLIVIAIILILIAIALPNFLEAQIRAKVTKAKGDLRTISTAMHSYYLDFKQFTADHDPSNAFDPKEGGLYQLTSPLQYLSALPTSTFTDESSGLNIGDEVGFEMGSTGVNPIGAAAGVRPLFNIHAFVVYSYGPDGQDNVSANDRWPFPNNTSLCGDSFITTYAPTNGSRSVGDIVEIGGEHRNGRYCLDGALIIGKGNTHTGNVPR